MAQTYKLVDLEEGTPVQYLGVYALKWRPEMGEPSVGFVEVDDTPRWIPVSERLPEEGVLVLVMGENCYNQPVAVVRKLTEHGWYDENDDYLMSFVTHWMPLPALPKEVEG